MVETPECNKMLEVNEYSQAIGEFIEWLRTEKHYDITETKRFTEVREQLFSDKTYETEIVETVPIRQSIERLLAEYFNIDLDKVEMERREILKELQKASA
jgi:hypothetical protein